ncbi:hypothetical protein [Mobiluncus mulieris]|uniref:Uncharacterized protein n=1 Tax=Mobiluncus mulieris TaxID=2052 RepID=A0A7Y0YH72_9ACTO|nr:hypothetical protein [Mobiluncus mulieris]NMX02801.1 hypothetical protein [Mobiluncus mulieris]
MTYFQAARSWLTKTIGTWNQVNPSRIETATNTLLQKFIAGVAVAAAGKLPVATTAIEYEPLAEKISAQLGFPVPWFTYRALVGAGMLRFTPAAPIF